MNPTLKRYLLSSLTTFLTVGISALAVELSTNSVQWTWTFWLTIAMVVIRAGFKGIVEGLAGNNADITTV
jgi:hypothetical protein